MKRIYKITLALIGLIVIGFFIPYPLGITTPTTSYYPNSTCFGCNDKPDTFILSFLVILILIIVVIGIVILLYPSKKDIVE